MNPDSNRRSPLTSPNLRQAGESVQSRQFDIAFDQVVLWFCILAIGGTTIVWSLLIWLTGLQATAPAMWIFGAAAIVVGFWRIHCLRPQIDALRIGAQGERAVGELLDDLTNAGYRAIHDLQFDGFNVDHVLVGPAGVIAIETKARSKSTSGRNVITFDGSRVRINDGPWRDDDVKQAERQARAVEDLLRRYLGKSVNVRPALLYPGWFVKGPDRQAAIWVTNQNRFAGFVRRERSRLSDIEVRQVFELLATHQRSFSSAP